MTTKRKKPQQPTFDRAIARMHHWLHLAGRLATAEQAQVLADLLMDVGLGIRGVLAGVDMSDASIVIPNDEVKQLLAGIDNYMKTTKKPIGDVVAMLLKSLGPAGATTWS